MNDEINKSFTEVLDVINHMEEKLYVKIPKEFIKLITENRDKNYEITIDYSRGINESNLLKETRVILSLIYISPKEAKYLASSKSFPLSRFSKTSINLVFSSKITSPKLHDKTISLTFSP